MKRISVQAYEDRIETEGGHAVLLLDGVMSIPDRLTIKLRSADANQAGAGETGWQDSEIIPLATRLSNQGVELVIGPDVAEDPALLAGSVMELEIPEAGLKGEFLWPHITPRARPKRKNIAPNRPRRDVRSGDTVIASDDSISKSAAIEPDAVPVYTNSSDVAGQAHAIVATGGQASGQNSQEMAIGGGGPAPEKRPAYPQRPLGTLMEAHLKSLKNATSVPALPLSLPLNDAGRSIVSFERKTPASVNGTGLHPVQPPLVQSSADQRNASPSVTSAAVKSPAAVDRTAMETAAEAVGLSAEDLLPPLIDPHGAHVNLSTSIVLQSDPDNPNEPKAEQNPWAWRKDVTAMLSTKFMAMSSPTKTADGLPASSIIQSSIADNKAIVRSGPMPAWVRDNAEAGASYLKRANADKLRSNWLSYALGAGAAVALGALALQASGKLPSLKPAASTVSSQTAEPGAFASVPPAGTFTAPSPVDVTSQDSVTPAGSLFDALAVSGVSPRGTTGTGVSAAKALENANSMLMAEGASRDPAEGAFWLKRYIASIVGEERNMRTVTQLGSLYAEPAGQAPDFEKARTLWEIASAAGDPVAMCFLGQLHENGLGVELNKKSALNWYEQSKQAGGCATVDEAIARVRN